MQVTTEPTFAPRVDRGAEPGRGAGALASRESSFEKALAGVRARDADGRERGLERDTGRGRRAAAPARSGAGHGSRARRGAPIDQERPVDTSTQPRAPLAAAAAAAPGAERFAADRPPGASDAPEPTPTSDTSAAVEASAATGSPPGAAARADGEASPGDFPDALEAAPVAASGGAAAIEEQAPAPQAPSLHATPGATTQAGASVVAGAAGDPAGVSRGDGAAGAATDLATEAEGRTTRDRATPADPAGRRAASGGARPAADAGARPAVASFDAGSEASRRAITPHGGDESGRAIASAAAGEEGAAGASGPGANAAPSGDSAPAQAPTAGADAQSAPAGRAGVRGTRGAGAAVGAGQTTDDARTERGGVPSSRVSVAESGASPAGAAPRAPAPALDARGEVALAGDGAASVEDASAAAAREPDARGSGERAPGGERAGVVSSTVAPDEGMAAVDAAGRPGFAVEIASASREGRGAGAPSLEPGSAAGRGDVQPATSSHDARASLPSAPAPEPGAAHARAAAPRLEPQALPGWVERIRDATQLVDLADRSEIRVSLDPEGLGPIEVRLRMHGDGLRAVIVAENERTRALIAQQEQALGAAFERSSLRLSGFSVGSGLDDGAPSHTPADPDDEIAGLAPRAPRRFAPATSANLADVHPGGRLSLRA